MRTGPSRLTAQNHGLDLLRGLAAFGVAVYHFLEWRLKIQVQSLGTFSVYIFFVLSGLTMIMVYGNRFAGGITLRDAADFYRNRVARLMPLLIVVGVCRLLVDFSSGSFSDIGPRLIRFFLTVSGAFALQLPGFLSSTTGAWSLGIECGFYLVFPLAALAAMNSQPRLLVAITAFLVACQQFVMVLIRDFDTAAFWNYYITNASFAPFFAFGFLIFRLSKNCQTLNPLWFLVVFGIICVFSIVVPHIDLFRSPVYYLGLSAMAASCVWLAYRTNIPPVIAPFCFTFGSISYGLYLTHWLSDIIAYKFTKFLGGSLYVEFPLFVFISVAGAYASFRLLESPARAALKRRKLGLHTP